MASLLATSPRVAFRGTLFRECVLVGLVLAFGFTIGPITPAVGEDVVKIYAPPFEHENARAYPDIILTMVLESTKKDFGPYRIERHREIMSRARALRELMTGQLLNVHSAPARAEWEASVTPIYVPIRRGILGYRLLLVNRFDLPRFSSISTVDELMKMSAGLKSQWSITETMKNLGFNVVEGTDFEGLFKMLDHKRFDYFPRGINEVFDEFDTRTHSFPNMVIEPTKALFLPLPTYFFVTPTEPRLAERIKVGMFRILKDGRLQTAFKDFHSEFIERAGLKKRKILVISKSNRPGVRDLDSDLFWHP